MDAFADVAADQQAVREALENAREALKVRGEVLRGALQLSLALSEAERVLSSLVDEAPNGARRPSPTLGNEVAS